MATVHPGPATPPASTLTVAPDSAHSVTCPFCKAVISYALGTQGPLSPIPCPSCEENLLVLNPKVRPADEELVDKSFESSLNAIELSHRFAGIAVAVLACLLNYAFLSGMAYWMFGQIKSTHDPYDIDELFLSPLLLKSNGWTKLHLAAARGDLATATALVAGGNGVDRRNGSGRTALYEASKRGHTEVVILLLQHGANPNARTKQEYTPLLAAAEQGHADAIAALLSSGADLGVRCSSGDSALHRAVREGHLAATKTLLEHGISVNQKSHGETALEIAQHNENSELIEILRAHGGKAFSQAKAHRAQGVTFQKNGKIDKALFAYAEALNLDPDDAETYYVRGTALLQKDEPDEALIAFQAAIRLNPTYFEAYSAAASVHTMRRQWNQALALWDRFLAQQPQDGRAHFERSVVRRAKGDTKGFLQGLEQACSFGHQAAC